MKIHISVTDDQGIKFEGVEANCEGACCTTFGCQSILFAKYLGFYEEVRERYERLTKIHSLASPSSAGEGWSGNIGRNDNLKLESDEKCPWRSVQRGPRNPCKS